MTAERVSPSLSREAFEAFTLAASAAHAMSLMAVADPATQRLRVHALEQVRIGLGLLDLVAPPLHTEPYRQVVAMGPLTVDDMFPEGGTS